MHLKKLFQIIYYILWEYTDLFPANFQVLVFIGDFYITLVSPIAPFNEPSICRVLYANKRRARRKSFP